MAVLGILFNCLYWRCNLAGGFSQTNNPNSIYFDNYALVNFVVDVERVSFATHEYVYLIYINGADILQIEIENNLLILLLISLISCTNSRLAVSDARTHRRNAQKLLRARTCSSGKHTMNSNFVYVFK